MDKRFSVGVLVVAALLLAACGGTAPAAQAGITPAGAETCSEMAGLMEETLGREGTTGEAPFEDYVRGQTGTGCQVTVTGTGVDFPEGPNHTMAMLAAVEKTGWTQEVDYAAGGVQASVAAWSKGDELCLYTEQWEPAPEVDCPEDQPISACEMQPEQRLWTITLNCATVSE